MNINDFVELCKKNGLSYSINSYHFRGGGKSVTVEVFSNRLYTTSRYQFTIQEAVDKVRPDVLRKIEGKK